MSGKEGESFFRKVKKNAPKEVPKAITGFFSAAALIAVGAPAAGSLLIGAGIYFALHTQGRHHSVH